MDLSYLSQNYIGNNAGTLRATTPAFYLPNQFSQLNKPYMDEYSEINSIGRVANDEYQQEVPPISKVALGKLNGFGLQVQQSSGYSGHGLQPGNPGLLYGNPTPILQIRAPISHQYNGLIYEVKFKRKVRYFMVGSFVTVEISVGEHVKVEADRGEDLGIVQNVVSQSEFHELRRQHILISGTPKDEEGVWELKQIIRLASPYETKQLPIKAMEEMQVVEVNRLLSNLMYH